MVMLFIESIRLFKSLKFILHYFLVLSKRSCIEALLCSMAFSSIKCTPLVLTKHRFTIPFIKSPFMPLLSTFAFFTSSNISTVFCLSDSIISSYNFCFVFYFNTLNYSFIWSDVSLDFLMSCWVFSRFFLFSIGGSDWVLWYDINSEVSKLDNFYAVMRFF